MATYRADINPKPERKLSRRIRWVIGTLVALAVLGIATLVAARAYLLDGLPELPDKRTMWELNLRETITLVDSDGKALGHRGPYIGQPLKLNEMPADLPNAVLAIEDERFFEHEGIDNKAIVRALLNNMSSGERSQGGSTLTQQLVKTMILTPEKTYRRKFQEALLARDMEAVMSKPEILELYINRISLGPQIYGVEAAARQFFGKSARDVNLQEAAMLAGLAQAPSRYNPTRNFDAALDRSHRVLDRMYANGFISELQRQDALANPPVIVDSEDTALPETLIGYAFDYVDETARKMAGPNAPDLVVTVTLNPDLMKSAADSLSSVIDKRGTSRKVSQGAIVTIDNDTGAILAMVGGRDYADSQFNRAVQAKRQPGSSFKAFVYAAALESGFTPATVRVDQPTRIGKWEPENYTLRHKGPMTIREAMKLSINTIAAQVGSEVGPDKVAELAQRFGIASELRPELSLSLGSSEVNLLELTGAYTVFANEGVLKPAHIISKIETTSGDVLYERQDRPGMRVYPVPYSRQMTSMMRDTIDTGTAYGAKLGSRQAAGKTGTSQDYRDGWFIGFTRQMTTGVWMGNDDNSPMREVTGGLLPVDVWKSFMVKAHKNVPRRPLRAPEPMSEGRAARIVSFYESLSSDLERERDLAAGISTN